jgi:hypothetical protein
MILTVKAAVDVLREDDGPATYATKCNGVQGFG